METYFHTNTYTCMFTAVLFLIALIEESAHMTFKGRVVKQTAVQIYHGILLSSINKQTTDRTNKWISKELY